MISQLVLLRIHSLQLCQRFEKKSGLPKLPDLRASAIGLSSKLSVQGTPGSICGPILRMRILSARTTAPARFTAGDDEFAHSRRHKPPADLGEGFLDQGTGPLGAELALVRTSPPAARSSRK